MPTPEEILEQALNTDSAEGLNEALSQRADDREIARQMDLLDIAANVSRAEALQTALGEGITGGFREDVIAAQLSKPETQEQFAQRLERAGGGRGLGISPPRARLSEEVKEEERARLAGAQEKFPAQSAVAETLGAALPFVAAGGPLPAALGRLAPLAAKAAGAGRVATLGGAGALRAFGKSDKEKAEEAATDMLIGSALNMGGGVVGAAIGNFIRTSGSQLLKRGAANAFGPEGKAIARDSAAKFVKKSSGRRDPIDKEVIRRQEVAKAEDRIRRTFGTQAEDVAQRANVDTRLSATQEFLQSPPVRLLRGAAGVAALPASLAARGAALSVSPVARSQVGLGPAIGAGAGAQQFQEEAVQSVREF